MSTWQEWQEAPWGRLRYSIVEANLVRHLDSAGSLSLRVLDLGGGDGGDAVRLAAQGHRVTIVDFAPAMLAAATERAGALGLGDLIACVEADATDLPEELAAAQFDAVICHNLLQYVDDVRGLLGVALGALIPGGLLSVMALNRYSEALRIAVREADPSAARAALTTDRARTEMFDSQVTLHTAEEITAILTDLGCQGIGHYGIRTFCDYIDDECKGEPDFFVELERLELAATALPPYIHLARLFQLIARKTAP
ncbi:methyltransferase domain-containing protein [Nocardia sp. SYP-A9097]|uniref:methyltransferase domain-containing protein n=1 Tax=Nocardia sp. SYP-A9097 TaxID=2663237 RepID=UPI001E55FC5F|nr:methyltransferase domain-containing protein [Nocardia sp. SYP-A9097]